MWQLIPILLMFGIAVKIDSSVGIIVGILLIVCMLFAGLLSNKLKKPKWEPLGCYTKISGATTQNGTWVDSDANFVATKKQTLGDPEFIPLTTIDNLEKVDCCKWDPQTQQLKCARDDLNADNVRHIWRNLRPTPPALSFWGITWISILVVGVLAAAVIYVKS
jgi:hypothetical protein